jgi:predicted transcriptional regulator
MQHNQPTISTLAALRALCPDRGLTTNEAFRIAQRQAQALLSSAGVNDGPIPLALFARLPRITLAVDPALPTSGMSYWNGEAWRLVAHADEHPHRQRFSLAHEFKHVIDHSRRDLLYADHRTREAVADYFAACLLMPRQALTRAWCAGTQDLDELSERFMVSTPALQRRLHDLGLLDRYQSRRYRCDRPSSRALTPARHLAIAGQRSITGART